MTTPIITQIIDAIQSADTFPDQLIRSLIDQIPTSQYIEAKKQIKHLCHKANTNQDAQLLTQCARTLFMLTKEMQDEIGQLAALYYAALAEYHQMQYQACISRLNRAIDRAYHIQSNQGEGILADIHYLNAYAYFHLQQYTDSSQQIQFALTLYRQHNNQGGIDNTLNLQKLISASQTAGVPIAPSEDVLAQWQNIRNEMHTAESNRESLKADITTYTQHRDELIQHIQALQKEHNQQIDELSQAYQIAQQHHINALAQLDQDFQKRNQEHTRMLANLEHEKVQHLRDHHARQQEQSQIIEKLDRIIQDKNIEIAQIQTRVRIWQHAEHMPYWLALIGHELQQRCISEASLEFIQQLYTLAPQEALATLVEIEARSTILPRNHYQLDDLHGEIRLFAATANARVTHTTDEVAAIHQLVDAWEIFLKETA